MKQKNHLDAEIERLEVELTTLDVGSERYVTVENALEKLVKLKDIEEKRKLSFKDVVPIVSNVALGLAVIFAENTRAVTSKAMQFVSRGFKL